MLFLILTSDNVFFMNSKEYNEIRVEISWYLMVPVQFLRLVKEGIITEIFAVAHDANLMRISPTWISPTIVYSIWYDYSFAFRRYRASGFLLQERD